MSSNDKNRPVEMADFFDSVADTYEGHMLPRKAEFYARIFEPVCETEEPIHVLNLGIGTGLELPGLLSRAPNARITGIDLSIEMLNRLRSEFSGLGERLQIIHGSYLEFDFPEATYDYVVSVMSFHHLLHGTKAGLYEKIRMSLKDGGRYIEGDYVAPDKAYEQQQLDKHKEATTGMPGSDEGAFHVDLPFTLDTQIELLQQAGFRSIQIIFHEDMAAILVATDAE
jgi:tRNA (cmo5U34)-methyltransferase